MRMEPFCFSKSEVEIGDVILFLMHHTHTATARRTRADTGGQTGGNVKIPDEHLLCNFSPVIRPAMLLRK